MVQICLLPPKRKRTPEGVRFLFQQDIYKPDGTPVVKATVTVVCIENGRLSRGEILAQKFEEYLNR